VYKFTQPRTIILLQKKKHRHRVLLISFVGAIIGHFVILLASMACYPWSSSSEFVLVADWLCGGQSQQWRKALATLDMWSRRVHRMPTGVEVTSPLIRAQIVSEEDEMSHLARCAAILRFLNVVAALAEKKLGLATMTEAAEALGVPSWVVSLRHAVAHGAVPGRQEVSDAVLLATKWILKNYWQPEADRLRETPAEPQEHERLRSLVDLYGYLKLYAVWGTKRVRDLNVESSADVYDHIRKLWIRLWPNLSVDVAEMDESAGRASGEAFEYLASCAKNASGDSRAEMSLADSLRESLTVDELLLPRAEVLTSMEYKGRGVPADLLTAWSDVLASVAAKTRALPLVLMGLFDAAVRGGHDAKLAEAWIVEICSRIENQDSTKEEEQPSKKKRKKSKSVGPTKAVNKDFPIIPAQSLKANPNFNRFVDYCLEEPSEVSIRLLPSLAKVRNPAMSKEQQAEMSNLMGMFLGKIDGSISSGDQVAKVDNLAERKSVFSTEDEARLLLSPPGLLPGQQAEDLFSLLTVEDGEEEAQGGHSMLECEERMWFRVPTLDWTQVLTTNMTKKSDVEVDESVPAFYRPGPTAKAKRVSNTPNHSASPQENRRKKKRKV